MRVKDKKPGFSRGARQGSCEPPVASRMQMEQQYVTGIGLSSDNIYRPLSLVIIQVMERAGKNDPIGDLELRRLGCPRPI
ncbi:MAG: hypothetical protein A2Z40_01425 [Deltaproteobacteria bacterium RBG_19FT_COMBO_60_16]|nr:MAG: hypothetical protein A2Z13_03335 [Deltaproteobacteria bacterium RBG_16_64_85]OGQ00628.1 MAG: hypothetical protein A2Z40_01425 [Deltaproteobacteria bacterium RBG_19FT_COMBO_60_16]